MKQRILAFIALLMISSKGIDRNPGTIKAPFATRERAIDSYYVIIQKALASDRTHQGDFLWLGGSVFYFPAGK